MTLYLSYAWVVARALRRAGIAKDTRLGSSVARVRVALLFEDFAQQPCQRRDQAHPQNSRNDIGKTEE